MVDLETKTIRRLFHEQVRKMTRNTPSLKLQTFDLQFSDRWFR
ncbi:MAG TPA: hypothetical protein VLJ21_02320 [Candidatus Binatia bacterium]|nr:hypothetical protein [Candidatus Binatia bacterium]